MTPIKRFEQKIARCPIAGCWIWLGAMHPRGYGYFYNLNGKKNVRAHRAAWELYRGPIPDGLHVLHHCDVPLCVNPHHLFLGTQLDNMRDMERKGRAVRSDIRHYNIPRRKLSEADILQIRQSNETQFVLAARFGVSQPTISAAKRGLKYCDIPGGIV